MAHLGNQCEVFLLTHIVGAASVGVSGTSRLLLVAGSPSRHLGGHSIMPKANRERILIDDVAAYVADSNPSSLQDPSGTHITSAPSIDRFSGNGAGTPTAVLLGPVATVDDSASGLGPTGVVAADAAASEPGSTPAASGTDNDNPVTLSAPSASTKEPHGLVGDPADEVTVARGRPGGGKRLLRFYSTH